MNNLIKGVILGIIGIGLFYLGVVFATREIIKDAKTCYGRHCVSSHTETTIEYDPALKMSMPKTRTVCDLYTTIEYKCDVIIYHWDLKLGE